MKNIDVIYSPLCEASIAFVEGLKEWLRGQDVRVFPVSYDPDSAAQAALYRACGQLVRGRMMESCFVDVFYQGRRVDTVPLSKGKIYAALGIPLEDADSGAFPNGQAAEGACPQVARHAIRSGAIAWIPITGETAADEMRMCLFNYPFGNPPARFHAQCFETKQRVFDEVWRKESCAGVYGKLGDTVIGLLEVLPREILKKHGFMTGRQGRDEAYLTVGCYEVGRGMPRVEVLDALMWQLENIYPLFAREMLEGIGVLEWPDGFTPYWVYDKYGFQRQERMNERKFVMQKRIKAAKS